MKKNKIFFIFLILSFFIVTSTVFLFSGCIGSKPPRYIPEAADTTVVKEEIVFGAEKDQQEGSDKIISIASSGTVKKAPDEVSFYIIVSTERPSGEEAAAENSAVSANVLTALESFGENNLKIETSGYSLSPLYDYQENKPPVIYAYNASESFSVKTKMIDKTGEIITVAVEAGASYINDITYNLSDETKKDAKNEALKMAVKDAEQKAQTLAEAIAAEIVEIISVRETNLYYSEPVIYNSNQIRGEGGEGLNLSPVIIPRELEVTAEINVVYSFK